MLKTICMHVNVVWYNFVPNRSFFFFFFIWDNVNALCLSVTSAWEKNCTTCGKVRDFTMLGYAKFKSSPDTKTNVMGLGWMSRPHGCDSKLITNSAVMSLPRKFAKRLGVICHSKWLLKHWWIWFPCELHKACHQLRVRRALMLFKDVLLRTRRALLLYKVPGNSALLVLVEHFLALA